MGLLQKVCPRDISINLEKLRSVTSQAHVTIALLQLLREQGEDYMRQTGTAQDSKTHLSRVPQAPKLLDLLNIRAAQSGLQQIICVFCH